MLSATITYPWGSTTTLGRGNCGSRTYANVGDNTIQAILTALQQGGAVVTGDNPWDVDTRQHGVKLRGTWDPNSGMLVVEIVDSDFVAPCSRVVSAIDSNLRQVIAANPSPQSGIAPTAIPLTSDLEPLANEVAEKANANGNAVVEVTNIFRLTPSGPDRNAIALRAMAIAAVTSPGKVASIQASLTEANELTPATIAEPTLVSSDAATPSATGLSLGAKIGLGMAIVGALAVTAFVIRRAVGTMRA